MKPDGSSSSLLASVDTTSHTHAWQARRRTPRARCLSPRVSRRPSACGGPWTLVLGGVRPSSALQQQQCSCPALHQRVHTLRSAHPDDQCQGAHTTHGVSHAAGPVLAPLPPHQHGERSSRRWTYHCSGADAVRVSSRSSSPAQAHGALAMSRMSCRALPTPYRIASASPRALAHPYSTNSSSWQVG